MAQESRVYPHSGEAEMGVLGSMLIDKRAIGETVEIINSEYFYVPAHQIIYDEIVDEWNKAKPVELIAFTQKLRDKNLLDSVGGASAVTNLFTFVPSSANLIYYLEILRDKYLCRQSVAIGTQLVRRAYEEQDDVSGMIGEAQAKILSIDNYGKSSDVSIRDMTMEAIESIEKAFERKSAITGIATGFSDFDKMTGGLQNSEMIVIAARPSQGKTALLMNMAENIAIDQKLPVGVFSLEMSKEQLIQRLLCSRSRVNMQRVREGFLTERDFPALTTSASKISESGLHIDDRCGITILELRAKARRWKLDFDIAVLVVDYLQLLRGTNKQSHLNREREISEISSGLKALAKELKIPVVVAAQLNRQPDARSGGRPKLSDLRESGSIEQDADTVGLLIRPEVYEEDEDARLEKAGEAELIVAKQRNGPTGDILLTFLKEYTRFTDRAKDYKRDGYVMPKITGPKCSVWEAKERITAITSEMERIKSDSANYDHDLVTEGGKKLKELPSSQLTRLAAEKTRLNQRIAQG